MKINAYIPLLAACLTGCDAGEEATAPAASPTAEFVRTCDSITPEVIRTAATNGVTIVKIYDPKTIKTEPKKISCSGRALVSSGQEATIYYRSFQDEDGDWLIRYAEQRLD